jgi:hypothetical protein
MGEGRWLSLGYILSVVFAFAIFMGMMALGAEVAYISASTTPEGMVIANQTVTEVHSIRQTATTATIFLNNFQISIWLFIPLIGFTIFLFTMFNTGQIMGYLSAFVGVSPTIYLEAIIFPIQGIPLPIGSLEILAYAILAGEGTYLLVLGVRHESLRERLKSHSWKSLLLYVAVLLLAAWIEAIIIGSA